MKYHIEVYRKHRQQKTLLFRLEVDDKKDLVDGEAIGEHVEEVIWQDIGEYIHRKVEASRDN
jgi:Mn-dependent DtxR family transcriptional regulator